MPRITEVRTIVLEGEIDTRAVIALERRMAQGIQPGCLVVNVSAVDVPDEPALRGFSEALLRVTRHGWRVAIAGASPALQHVLERCAIDGVELCPSFRIALAAAGRGRPTTRPA